MDMTSLLASNAFFLVIFIVVLVAMWKIFTKAGKPGWASIVPIYSLVIYLQIVKKPLWWVVLFFIPVVNFVIFILVSIALAKEFGKGTGFGIGLLFLPFIFFPMLAFGSAQYAGAEVAPAPESGDTPTPESPAAPEVPTPPVTLEAPVSEAPMTPDVPEAPMVPEVPQAPVAPEVPQEAPMTPEPPVVPEMPQTPVAPEVPSEPASPEITLETEPKEGQM